MGFRWWPSVRSTSRPSSDTLSERRTTVSSSITRTMVRRSNLYIHVWNIFYNLKAIIRVASLIVLRWCIFLKSRLGGGALYNFEIEHPPPFCDTSFLNSWEEKTSRGKLRLVAHHGCCRAAEGGRTGRQFRRPPAEIWRPEQRRVRLWPALPRDRHTGLVPPDGRRDVSWFAVQRLWADGGQLSHPGSRTVHYG